MTDESAGEATRETQKILGQRGLGMPWCHQLPALPPSWLEEQFHP
jgi:hypothetical protein